MPLNFPPTPSNGDYDSTGKWQFSSTPSPGVWKAVSNQKTVIQPSPTPPANPVNGNVWFNTVNGTTYVYYNDGNTAQWVEMVAPISANGYYSPNYVINGAFDIWQRGTSSTSGVYYQTADRWAQQFTVSATFAQVSNPNAGFQYCLGITLNATGVAFVDQIVETKNAVLLAGKTSTLSAYFYSTSAIPVTVYFEYTTLVDSGVAVGGIGIIATNTVTLVPNTWTRVPATGLVPDNAKTIRVRVGTISNVPSGTFYAISGVQLEEGSVATPFRRNANSLQGELAACQRYYQRIVSNGIYGPLAMGWAYSTTAALVFSTLKNTMRVFPHTLDYSNVSLQDNYSPTIGAVSNLTITSAFSNENIVGLTVTSSSLTAGKPYVLAGNNNTTTYLGLSAEL